MPRAMSDTPEHTDPAALVDGLLRLLDVADQGGDHFAKPGANDRVWGALDKLAVADPETFAAYYSNDVLALGQTRRWRSAVLDAVAPQPGERVLDLAAGTVTPIQTSSPAPLAHASWCADGRHLVAAQSGWLVVVDSVTGKVTRLTPSMLGDCSEPDCWTRRAN